MRKSIAESYDKIARDYFRQHGQNEQLSVPSLKKFISLLPSDAEVLDVGCGGGQDSKFLAESGCTVMGIDVSQEMIKIAKLTSPKSDFQIADIAQFSTSKKYDGIWCCRVFQHISLSEQDAFLDKLNSLLKNDGILYITSVVSDSDKNYEAYDSGNENLLKKRLTAESFKKLLIKHSFSNLELNVWEGEKGMEILARKS